MCLFTEKEEQIKSVNKKKTSEDSWSLLIYFCRDICLLSLYKNNSSIFSSVELKYGLGFSVYSHTILCLKLTTQCFNCFSFVVVVVLCNCLLNYLEMRDLI